MDHGKNSMSERSGILKKGMESIKECDKMTSKNIDNIIKSFDEMPLFLNVEEVSQVFDIGRNSAYNLFKSEGFPKIKIAGQFRVCKDNLMVWLQNQKHQRK
jgi:predicted DNA-binding transcriptional regulator AlpA